MTDEIDIILLDIESIEYKSIIGHINPNIDIEAVKIRMREYNNVKLFFDSYNYNFKKVDDVVDIFLPIAQLDIDKQGLPILNEQRLYDEELKEILHPIDENELENEGIMAILNDYVERHNYNDDECVSVIMASHYKKIPRGYTIINKSHYPNKSFIIDGENDYLVSDGRVWECFRSYIEDKFS